MMCVLSVNRSIHMAAAEFRILLKCDFHNQNMTPP
jgi:hypothetical protein